MLQAEVRTMHIHKILIVNPQAPKSSSFWGFEGVNAFLGVKSAHGSLALATLAALVPSDMEVETLDESVRVLAQSDLDRCDAVFVTGMTISRVSIDRIVKAAIAAGKPVVVGGPFASSEPDAPEFFGASVFVGEGIDRKTWLEMIADLERGQLRSRYEAMRSPPITASPVPRFDLWNLGDFSDAMIQTTIGCPYHCDFCGVWTLHGAPRTKEPAQVEAEFSALYRTGYRGGLFVADDNYGGNPKAALRTAQVIRDWQKRHGFPFACYTQVSIGLAKNDELVNTMADAGFTAVFLGLESPSNTTLAGMGKNHNVGVDVPAAITKLRRAGLRVHAGFIVGNEGETTAAFAAMAEFVERLAIPRAMVGMRVALKGTVLHANMEKQGRLLAESAGDQMASTNIRPDAMSLDELLEGHRALIAKLFAPAAYFRRVERELAEWKMIRSFPIKRRDLRAALLSVLRQGVLSDYRAAYWRFIANVLRKHPSKIGTAIASAVVFSHFWGYTRHLESERVPTLETAFET